MRQESVNVFIFFADFFDTALIVLTIMSYQEPCCQAERTRLASRLMSGGATNEVTTLKITRAVNSSGGINPNANPVAAMAKGTLSWGIVETPIKLLWVWLYPANRPPSHPLPYLAAIELPITATLSQTAPGLSWKIPRLISAPTITKKTGINRP